MRLAVTGKTGQVVTALLERGEAMGAEIVALGRPEIDLGLDRSVLDALAGASTDVIVSAAAYSAVD